MNQDQIFFFRYIRQIILMLWLVGACFCRTMHKPMVTLPIELMGVIADQMPFDESIPFLKRLACINKRYKKFFVSKLEHLKKEFFECSKEEFAPEKWVLTTYGFQAQLLFLQHPLVTIGEKVSAVKYAVRRAKSNWLRHFKASNICAEARGYYMTKIKKIYSFPVEMHRNNPPMLCVYEVEIPNISFEFELIMLVLRKGNVSIEAQKIFELLSAHINPFNKSRALYYLLKNKSRDIKSILPWFDMMAKGLNINLKQRQPAGFKEYYKELFKISWGMPSPLNKQLLERLAELSYDFEWLSIKECEQLMHNNMCLGNVLLSKLSKSYLEKIFLCTKNLSLYTKIFQTISPISEEVLIAKYVKIFYRALNGEGTYISMFGMLRKSLWEDYGIDKSHPKLINAVKKGYERKVRKNQQLQQRLAELEKK